MLLRDLNPGDRFALSIPSLDGARHPCGGVFHLVSEPTDIVIRGMAVRVPRDMFRCDGCGAVRIALEQLDAARERAAEKLREADDAAKEPTHAPA